MNLTFVLITVWSVGAMISFILCCLQYEGKVITLGDLAFYTIFWFIPPIKWTIRAIHFLVIRLWFELTHW